MTAPESGPVRWSFVRHRGNGVTTWLWQQFGPDGRLQKTSEEHSTYGKAMVNALAHGFRPSEDDYSVDLPHGRMHFPPGRDPQFEVQRLREIPRDRDSPKRPAPNGDPSDADRRDEG